MPSSSHLSTQSNVWKRLPMTRQTREMGSLSTLLLSCLQRKQRPTPEAADERPPVPAKEPLSTSSISNSYSKSPAPPTYAYTYTCRQSEQCPSITASSQSGTESVKISNTGTGIPTKLSKRSSIRIVNNHDSESTLVSSSSSTSEGQTLAGSRNVSRSGSEEKDVEAGEEIEGERTVSAIIEAGLEDLERQIKSDSERTGSQGIVRSCSLPEIKSRVIEDIPEEDEILSGNGAATEQQQQHQEKELPSLPKEAHTVDQEKVAKETDEEEEKELSTKSKSFRDSFRLSGRKSLIEMVHFLQPPTNRFSGLKIPIPPKSPLRKKASTSSMPCPADLLRSTTSAATTTTSPLESSPSTSPLKPEPLSTPAPKEEKTTPRTKKHRRMGAVGMGNGIPLRVRQSLDGLNINNTGKKSLFC
ncbi:uncharacterized protein KD926_008822 [Aspergillus affinis]|uniref:uncharacterized protein n=1 Tax=Aspergillus affinis TaxID=1070780 RepID=UPI0022FDD827|nr:uncharacterized protein KD926_008822 [Aspergillus affinis]KAI9045395.1 hypothetical protein KD926_008822 [Aspergillus affinis]